MAKSKMPPAKSKKSNTAVPAAGKKKGNKVPAKTKSNC